MEEEEEDAPGDQTETQAGGEKEQPVAPPAGGNVNQDNATPPSEQGEGNATNTDEN